MEPIARSIYVLCQLSDASRNVLVVERRGHIGDMFTIISTAATYEFIPAALIAFAPALVAFGFLFSDLSPFSKYAQ